MVSGVNSSMSGVNVSMPDVSGQLLSKPVLTIPTEWLSVKSLCSIINVLIEDLQSAKSRILELEHQQPSFTGNHQSQALRNIDSMNKFNPGKWNESNQMVKFNDERTPQNVLTQHTTDSHKRSENDVLLCRFCNQLHKRGKNYCPAHGNTCSRCKRLNHFTSTCKTNIGKNSIVSNFQKLSSTENLKDLRKSKSEPDLRKSKSFMRLENDSKNHREKDQLPQASNPNCKRRKDLGSLKNPKQPPMYPHGYLDLQRNLLKRLKRRYCEDDYKRSHRTGNGSIWCANHYRWKIFAIIAAGNPTLMIHMIKRKLKHRMMMF